MILQSLGIDTLVVIEAAGTKWIFLPFKPGLFGGLCIGVDPYYLIQKSQSAGFYPVILLASRRINESMGRHVAAAVIRELIRRKSNVADARILILGLTFKENCPDLRNTRVVELAEQFRDYGAQVDIHDSWADPATTRHEYGLELLPRLPERDNYDAIVLAVAHDEYRDLGIDAVRRLGRDGAVVYDIKGLFPRDKVDGRL
jgi:UDP-N-acetyl-D-galactosamine dehydrogenase